MEWSKRISNERDGGVRNEKARNNAWRDMKLPALPFYFQSLTPVDELCSVYRIGQ